MVEPVTLKKKTMQCHKAAVLLLRHYAIRNNASGLSPLTLWTPTGLRRVNPPAEEVAHLPTRQLSSSRWLERRAEPNRWTAVPAHSLPAAPPGTGRSQDDAPGGQGRKLNSAEGPHSRTCEQTHRITSESEKMSCECRWVKSGPFTGVTDINTAV